MLLDTETAKAFLADFTENEKEYKEVIQGAIAILKGYAPEFKELFSELNDYLIDERHKTFVRLCNKGFSRNEAMLLMINSKVALTEAVERARKIQ